MLCYFLRDGHIAGVEMLPLGLSDEDAITRAHTLSSKRKGPFDGFEVWDRSRFVFRLPPSAEVKRLARRRPEGHIPFFQSFMSRSLQERSAAALLENLVRFEAESDDDPPNPSPPPRETGSDLFQPELVIAIA
jgi:hypothetical protein